MDTVHSKVLKYSLRTEGQVRLLWHVLLKNAINQD